jgi:hypothetical protein
MGANSDVYRPAGIYDDDDDDRFCAGVFLIWKHNAI